jgi:hypothetical protein
VLVLVLVLVLVSIASTAHADEDDWPEVHGFASQGFLLTSDNNYLAKSERGSFEFSEAGINFTKPLGEKLRTGIQLFSRDLGPTGDYRIKLDWFYLDYRWRDWLGLRAGRVKLPFGLYNDTSDVDAAHSSALLPQSMYPAQNRDYLLAQTGVELYGYVDLKSGGALDYRAYAGTIFLDPTTTPGSMVEVLELTIPYVVGGRLMWEPPVEALRVGASAQALRLEGDLLLPGPMPLSFEIPGVLWAASVEYAPDDMLFAAEYSQWHLGLESSDPMTYPEQTTVSRRGYFLWAYRVRPWLQPGAYVSVLYPDSEVDTGRDARQLDAALTTRFDINEHWLVKVELHGMRGTAALDSSLNDGRDTAGLVNQWGMLVVKTTAYF